MELRKPTKSQRDLLVSILHSRLARLNEMIGGYNVSKPTRAEAQAWYTQTINIALILEQVCGEEDIVNTYVLSRQRFEQEIKELK